MKIAVSILLEKKKTLKVLETKVKAFGTVRISVYS